MSELTRPMIFGEDTPLMGMIRQDKRVGARRTDEDALDRRDFDHVHCFHFYRTGRIVLVEEVSRRAIPDWPKVDTFYAVHLMLREGSRRALTFKRPPGVPKGRPASFRYDGFHLVQFENEGPEDGWMTLDGLLSCYEEFLHSLMTGQWKRRSMFRNGLPELWPEIVAAGISRG